MKVYNTQKLIVNCWSRVPIDFTVKLKYTNSASNNEYPFSITPPQANITKQVFEIVLIEGTIQSVSILANTPMILRGHTFFQCWVRIYPRRRLRKYLRVANSHWRRSL